ncbi:MAG: hypothetical protein OXG03_04970 [Gammaproteobacteria bacterium]|nr:hypothetical protein [Gammaproteobacteria bacterium]
MQPFEWGMIIGLVVVIGFLWKLHTDMTSFGQRLARVEGMLEVLMPQLKSNEVQS